MMGKNLVAICVLKFFYENAVNAHLFHAHHISMNKDHVSNISDIGANINKNRNEEDINTTEAEKPTGLKNTKKHGRTYCDKKNEEEDQKILTTDIKRH